MQLQNLSLVEDDIRRARETDRELSFWKAILISIITFGIYAILVLYRMINRRDLHFRRQISLNDDIIKCIKEINSEEERSADITNELQRAESLQNEIAKNFKEKGAIKWLILNYITLGLAGLYIYYFLTRDFFLFEEKKEEFSTLISSMLVKLGVVKYPIKPERVMKKRNFWLYLVLSIITLGIFMFYWYYILLEEPNHYFRVGQRWEEQIVNAFRSA